ncbi:uncharacterized protein LOC113780072 [Coffea eugenioides]|uniref:uncharacterized protein LOC113780072 n=1 Tax=Coffea eugenioides TaxID=49369 RepID=UPI000F61111E|nr:uncharacterized protein LOC113780072 [Coffea eugenioides]
MMARLLRNASFLGCTLFLQPLSQTYRKGLLGASTQLSYFSSKRRKSKSDVKERFGTQAGNVSDHCIIWKRFYHVAWLLCPYQTSSSCVYRFICFGYCTWDWRTFKGDFTKLDFADYNGPCRGYNQLGSIGYNTEQFFSKLRKPNTA